MILLDEFIKLNVSEAFLDMFLVVIQLGAILAVVVLYWDKLWPFRFGGGPIIKKKTFSMWFKIVVACIPAAIVGVLFDDVLTALFYNYITVAIMLILFGILFIIIENTQQIQKTAYPQDQPAHHVPDSHHHRYFPADRGCIPGHLPFRCHHRGRSAVRCFQNRCR